MILFTDIEVLDRFAKLRSRRGTYDGRADLRNLQLIRQCSHLLSITPESSARMIYTRDAGHHSGGWWKNPDYERCFHLSISFCVNPTDAALPFDRNQAARIARAFFGADATKCWVEPPYLPEGRATQCHHYRLFADEQWRPLVPRGEVYDRSNTPPEWKSFSELHGFTPTVDQAPWLRAASE